jgi:hypothetical protein
MIVRVRGSSEAPRGRVRTQPTRRTACSPAKRLLPVPQYAMLTLDPSLPRTKVEWQTPMYPIARDVLSIEGIAHLWSETDKSVRPDAVELELWDAYWDGDLVLCDGRPTTVPLARRDLLLKFARDPRYGPLINDHGAAINPIELIIRAKGKLSEKQFCKVYQSMKGVTYFDLNDGGPSSCRWPYFLTMKARRGDFRQLCLLRSWPLPKFWFSDTDRQHSSARTELADANLRRWLREEVFDAPRKSKDVIWDEARRQFNVSRKKFDSAWREMAPDTWKAPGRRRESERDRQD